MKYSEKDIVDAVKFACKSFTNIANKPGIFYMSGIKYMTNTNGNLQSMSYVDRLGNEIPIDIDNPRENKYYITVLNDYCAQGNDGFTHLNQPGNIIEKYDFDATKCVQEVLQQSRDEVDIYDDGRIQIAPPKA